MDKWINFIQQKLCPDTCLLCGEPGHNNNDLCNHCYDTLPWLTHYCERCGLSMPIQTAQCGDCLKKPPPYEKTISLMHYEEKSRYLITSLKLSSNYPASRLMGNMMLEKLRNESNYPELLIPMPLHPARYRKRGFNQAIEIARPISKALDIPMDNTIAQRIVDTGTQTKLHAKERRKNLRGAFQINKPITSKHIAIIDDVITTGSTVTELAKVLKKAGAERIDIWSFARA